MNRLAVIGTGLVSLVGFAGAASAADLPARTKAPIAAPVMTSNWTGCYIGGHGGGGWARTRQEFAPPFTGLFSDIRGGDAIGGGQFGCEYQFDRFVIGAQGRFDFGQINSSQVEPLFPTFASTAQTRQIFTAAARAGYLVLPSVLAYVRGGEAWAQTYLASIGSVPNAFLSESATSNRPGWTAGGGAEWMFSPGWSVFAEYDYMDFGTRLTQYVSGPNTIGAPNILNVKLTTQTALVGVNYKFGWGGPPVAAGFAGTASAADPPARTYSKAPAVFAPIAYDWSGFYLGGQGWYAGSSGSYALVEPAVTEAFRFNPNSFIGGGHAGLQGQWGSGVFGVEATYNALDQKQTDIAVLLRGRLRMLSTKDIATVVGKAGYAAGPLLFYVKGGFADARIDTFGVNPASGVFGDVNAWQTGFTLGGGMDYMFAKGWIAGVDFNYYDFRFDRPVAASSGVATNFTGKNDVYAGMFRLSYLFSWTGPV